MKPDIPYYSNPTDTHCAQATLRMGYEYFNPEKIWSWEELDELTGHVPGLTTWNMKGYIGTKKLGYDVIVYDSMDYNAFVLDPHEYISKKFNPAYAEETFRLSNMEQAVADAKALLKMKNFPLYSRSYTLDEFRALLDQGYVCATWVDGAIVYNNADKCWPHFILVHSYDKTGIYAHDPGGTVSGGMMKNRHIPWDLFEKANKMNEEGERGEMMAFKNP